MSSSLKLLIAAGLAIASRAIDLELDTISCDGGLPIYALENGLKMTCGGEKRCTFGETALITGTLYYESVDEVGLTDNTAYASADLDLVTLNYHLFEDSPVSLCGDWISNSEYNWNTCPQDGTYHFAMNYTLPSGKGVSTWFATGWKGDASFSLFAQKSSTASDGTVMNSSVKLASCSLDFQTYTTAQNGASRFKSAPTAAEATLGVIVAALAMCCLLCLCACTPRIRRRRREKKAAAVQPLTPAVTTGKEDPASEFYRMEEQLNDK